MGYEKRDHEEDIHRLKMLGLNMYAGRARWDSSILFIDLDHVWILIEIHSCSLSSWRRNGWSRFTLLPLPPSPRPQDAADMTDLINYQTSSTLIVFLYAIVQNLEVQKLAQEEIDRVIGTSRLPDFNDRSSLPYVESILQEVYR